MIKTPDRVEDTTNSTGTGPLTLTGTAPNGLRTLASAISSGDVVDTEQVPYVLEREQGGWEFGLATITDGANVTVSRDVIRSSNSNNLLSLPSGTHRWYVADIERVRKNPWLDTAYLKEESVSVTAGQITLDWSQYHSASVSGTVITNLDVIFAVGINPEAPVVLTLAITFDGVYTVTWPANVKWIGGVAPDTSAGDWIFTFAYRPDGTYIGDYGVAT